MYTLNIKVDPDVVAELGLDEDSVVEAYFDNGILVIHFPETGDDDCLDPAPCDTCPLFCKHRGICTAPSNILGGF